MKRPPNLTPAQLAVYEVFHKVRMGWVALISAIALFTIVLAAFLYTVLSLKDQWQSQAIFGLTDATLGFALRGVYKHLFPPLCVDASGKTRRVS